MLTMVIIFWCSTRNETWVTQKEKRQFLEKKFKTTILLTSQLLPKDVQNPGLWEREIPCIQIFWERKSCLVTEQNLVKRRASAAPLAPSPWFSVFWLTLNTKLSFTMNGRASVQFKWGTRITTSDPRRLISPFPASSGHWCIKIYRRLLQSRS